ncbi:hypothetical protein PTH_0691 [Pelotomaculum thermopropionicum SI]|uniref:4Fe-4S ferredoxin-type domain-containing protein n=1 Tax=Pelotomaculum thermopropionicum (strain DSM 13744 / JCM 10971 / SI) TaxID=370438 RepID=A5D4H4_PELTS|nr:hypothetical protein PTH_0691 [Pelotomaculum thermopropionicum SI]
MRIPLHMAKEKELKDAGMVMVPPESLPRQLLAEVGNMVRSSRTVRVMLETCTRCGACAAACHSYLGTGDSCNIPALRADLLRNFYHRHFTLTGRLASWLTGRRTDVNEEIERWIDYSYQCNLCRRCAYYCPFGVDTAEIVMAMRYILARVGFVPRFYAVIVANLLKAGNNSGMLKPAVLDCCQFLEEELKEETGLDIKIPVDKPQADILYVPSSTEFTHNVDTLLGVAKVFHALGLNWTISSAMTEAANYGMFIDLDVLKLHNRRIVDAAREAGAALVVMGECGHAWRVARMFSEGANGNIPFKIMHVLELAAQNLDKLTLEKAKMRVTLHDPCNYARAGGIADAPRQILQACVTDFVEMTPNREMNYCCGGGSGMLMDEMMEVRMKLAKMKAEQLRALGRLDALAAPCATCKAQLPHVVRHYKLDIARVTGVMEILGQCLKL